MNSKLKFLFTYLKNFYMHFLMQKMHIFEFLEKYLLLLNKIFYD